MFGIVSVDFRRDVVTPHPGAAECVLLSVPMSVLPAPGTRVPDIMLEVVVERRVPLSEHPVGVRVLRPRPHATLAGGMFLRHRAITP